MDSRRRLATAAGCCALVLAAGACSGSSSANVDPHVLLQEAKAKADAASAVHFALSSKDVTGGGTNLTGGEGDLVRPDQLQGSFTVNVNGFPANVKAVSKGGVFEALLPFQQHYSKTDPANFGLTDPSQLFNPTHGLTSLLAIAQNPRSAGQTRVGGELLDQVTFTVPGTALPVLPDANPSQPVTLTVGINPKSHELRQITIVGPLTSQTNSTYTVTLTKFNEQVNVTLPPTS